MNVYTVHLKGSPDDPAALERAIFVREGFSWAALIFGPFWLLWNRLWLAVVVWVILQAGLVTWIVFAAPDHSIIAALQILIALLLGFEAAPLRRAALAKRRYETVGVVHGKRRMDAERAFFQRTGLTRSIATPTSAGAMATRAPEMVGLFPSARA